MVHSLKKKIDWDKPKKGLLNSINAISQTINNFRHIEVFLGGTRGLCIGVRAIFIHVEPPTCDSNTKTTVKIDLEIGHKASVGPKISAHAYRVCADCSDDCGEV